jgi:hypothetical protein
VRRRLQIVEDSELNRDLLMPFLSKPIDDLALVESLARRA